MLRNPSKRQVTSIRNAQMQQNQNVPSPQRQHFETVNSNFQPSQQANSFQMQQDSLNPLIKDYKLKPIYELDQNLKYQQMMGNGSAHYRANFDNRNKVIWNNTDFRLFNRDNPHSLCLIQLEDPGLKPVKDKSRLLGFDSKMPQEFPQVRAKLINENNMYNTISFKNESDIMPNSSYKDFHGSISKNFTRNDNPIQQSPEFGKGSQRKADVILREQAQVRDTFMTVAPSQRYNSVVSPFKSLTEADPQKPQSINRVQFQLPSQNTSLQPQQLLQHNNQMNSYMNVTNKYIDTQGRKPPSRHYQVDENTQKIYSALYPEPGVQQKQQSMPSSQNQLIKQYEQQNNSIYQQPLSQTLNHVQPDMRASYGSLIGLSRRIDHGIKEKQFLGDTFSQDKKYFDQIMRDNNNPNGNTVLTQKDLSPFITPDHLKLHQHIVIKQAVEEIEKHLEEDEDLQKEDLETAQETAGFHDLELRHAIGALFNHVFFFSILNNQDHIQVREPIGKLAELINKHFTDYSGLKESFKKVVLSRVLPGWVWLGYTKDGQLVITSTNNEDNTLMHGIALVQCLPIIGIDLWEHSYFSQYEGEKEAYVNRLWDCIDWERVCSNFENFNVGTYKLGPLV
eukprot:403331158